jgi:hypothetical protein
MVPSKLLSRFIIGIFVATFALPIVLSMSKDAANLLHAAAAPATIRVGYPQLNGGQTPLWNIAYWCTTIS